MARRRIAFRIVIAALGFFWFLPAAHADEVTPNERVTSKLKVRAEAKSSADVVGYLKPGDKADLVKTVGAWREIKFQTTTGYVSSSFTTVVTIGPAE